MERPKIRIVAICKDEAYFLPQWVHYHFFIGVDAIDIYYNRLTDNTLAVLDKLKAFYPDLNFYSFDWYDRRLSQQPYLQECAYSQAYENLTKAADYILFIDVDEYLFSRTGVAAPADFVARLGFPDIISLQWLNVSGLSRYCQPLLSRARISGFLTYLCKSIVRTGLNLSRIGCHFPLSQTPLRWIMADGSHFLVNNGEPAKLRPSTRSHFLDYFILHDWMQSPLFYLAHLVKGIGDHVNLGLVKKMVLNRPLYNSAVVGDPEFIVEPALPPGYFASFAKLIADADLSAELNRALYFAGLKALEALRLAKTAPDSQFAKLATDSFGSFDAIKTRIMDEIRGYGGVLPPEPPESRLEIILGKPFAEAVSLLSAASRFYPYAADEKGYPLYLKTLVQLCVDQGDLEQAEKHFHESARLMNNSEFELWASLLLAKAYEKTGLKEKALKYYMDLRFSAHADALKGIDRFSDYFK